MASLDNDELSVTLTVAIALDDETPPLATHKAAASISRDPAFEILPPISPTEACQLPPLYILTKHLSPEARKMLCLRLNPPQYGSMKNWEYVACIVGLTSDEIADLQRSSDPTNGLLYQLGDRPLEVLVAAIGQCKRIDVLITLSSFLSDITIQPAPAPIQRHVSFDRNNHDSAMYTLPSIVHQINLPPKRFILITWHIDKKAIDQKPLYKCAKWMEKNIKHSAKDGLDVINVEHVLDEADLYGSMDRFFETATQILLFATPQYYNDIVQATKTDATNSLIKLKQYLHRRMNEEYQNNNFQNYRFRVVKPDLLRSDAVCLPPGWPRNTIVYSFPNGSKDLFSRLNTDP